MIKNNFLKINHIYDKNNIKTNPLDNIIQKINYYNNYYENIEDYYKKFKGFPSKSVTEIDIEFFTKEKEKIGDVNLYVMTLTDINDTEEFDIFYLPQLEDFSTSAYEVGNSILKELEQYEQKFFNNNFNSSNVFIIDNIKIKDKFKSKGYGMKCLEFIKDKYFNKNDIITLMASSNFGSDKIKNQKLIDKFYYPFFKEFKKNIKIFNKNLNNDYNQIVVSH